MYFIVIKKKFTGEPVQETVFGNKSEAAAIKMFFREKKIAGQVAEHIGADSILVQMVEGTLKNVRKAKVLAEALLIKNKWVLEKNVMPEAAEYFTP